MSDKRDEMVLKDCPFCGWHAIQSGANRLYARCDNQDCNISSIAMPVEQWNRRAEPKAAAQPTLTEVRINSDCVINGVPVRAGTVYKVPPVAAAPDAGLVERLRVLCATMPDTYNDDVWPEDATTAMAQAAHALHTAHSAGVREGMEKAAGICKKLPKTSHIEYGSLELEAINDCRKAILAASKEMKG